MQESDEAQQHRQGDVLELTCNGMVSCLYSTVMSGHSADSATHAIQQPFSKVIHCKLVYGGRLVMLCSTDTVKCMAVQHRHIHVLLIGIFRTS